MKFVSVVATVVAVLGLVVKDAVVAQPSPNVCPKAFYELDTWTGAASVKASGPPVFETFDVEPLSGQLTLSLWVRMGPNQPSSGPMLIQIGCLVPLIDAAVSNATRLGDSLSVYWDSKESRIYVVLINNLTHTDGQSPVQTEVIDDGTVDLTTAQYRNVMVVLDATMGWIAIAVDGVLTGLSTSPALQNYGLRLHGVYSALFLGNDYYGQSPLDGALGDFTVVSGGVISDVGAKYLTMFRTHLTPTNASGNWTCAVIPSPSDRYYPFVGQNVQTFWFAPSGYFSFPGAEVLSPYAQFGFYPIYASAFSLQPQRFVNPPIQNASWTASEFASLSCGSMQSASIITGSATMTFEVMLLLNGSTVPPLGTTFSVTTTLGGYPLANITLTSASTDSVRIRFVFQGPRLDFTISSSTANYCVARAVLVERGSVVADPQVVFTGAVASLSLYTGIGANDTVALTSSGSCFGPSVTMLPVRAVFKMDVLSYFSVDIPTTATPGVNVLCVFPGGQVSAQAFIAARCPASDNTNTFLCSVLVVQPAPFGEPLPKGWVQNLLHLGASYTDHISHGLFETDYFISVGGERNVHPQAGDVASVGTKQLVWTEMTRPSALWGQFDGNNTLAGKANEWVQYFAVSLYAPFSQVISLSVRACSGLKVFVDGTNRFQLNPTYANLTNATEVVLSSNAFSLASGWHQVLVKLWRAPTVTTPMFSLRVDQGQGLWWSFSIPQNGSTNSTSPLQCPTANTSIPCVPGEQSVNLSHYECVALGCCYDPSVALGCFASSTAVPSYRTDGHCGLGWGALGANVSLCNALSSTGSTCCSNFGWCGSGSAHCVCGTCVDARYERTPRCDYVNWGSQVRCLGSTLVSLGNMLPLSCRQSCDFTSGCIGYTVGVNLATMTTTCVLSVSRTVSRCTASVTDPTQGTLYVKSCVGCGLTRNVTRAVTCGSLAVMQVYGAAGPSPSTYMPYTTCTSLCALAVACTGVQFNATSGQCIFLTGTCNSVLPSADNATSLSLFTCTSDAQPVPAPLPPPSNTSSFVSVGCYPDASATFLSAASYPGWNAYNVFQANYQSGMPTANISTSSCGEYCIALGAVYFAIAKGAVCTCGVMLPQNPPAQNEALCTTACPGNATQLCGGPAASSVFRTLYTQGPCPSSFVYFAGSCYQYRGAEGPSEWLSWHDARSSCNVQGASLVSLHSRHETQFVLSFATTVNQSNPQRIAWTGGYRYNEDNSVRWEDGSPWDFANWRPGEPNDANALESCLEVFSNYPTPYKGSFNDDGCEKPYPYICKMDPGATSALPFIYETLTDGVINCAPLSSVTSDIVDSLSAWWTFDRISNTSASVINDLSAQQHLLYYYHWDGTNISGVPTLSMPQLTPGIVRRAVVLNGSSYFVSLGGGNAGSWDVPRNQLSISVWIMPTSPSGGGNQIIVSKSYSPNATAVNVPQFEWALAYRSGLLCFIIGPYRACSQPPPTGRWAHVVGSFDGNLLALYINATEITTYDISFNANTSYAIGKNPNTTVVVGYRSALPIDATRMFVGLIDDLRIVNAALTDPQIIYFFYCVPNGAPGSMLNIYDEEFTAIVFAGEGFSENQMVALTTTGCAPGTPAYLSGYLGTYSAYETLYAYIYVSGLPPAQYYDPEPNQTTPTVYDLCYVNPLDTSVVQAAANFEILVTSITAVNGYTQQMVVNTTQFPLLLQVTGVNLQDGQILVSALDADCSILDGFATLFDTSLDQTTAYVNVSQPLIITDIIHLCWGSSTAALGDSDAAEAVGNLYLTNIGITVIMLNPSGIQYKRLAVIDGTTSVGMYEVTSGRTWSFSNYFLACDEADYFGDNFVLLVQMGEFQDYLIPLAGMSVCDVLTAYPWLSTHYVASGSPLGDDPSYDGTATLVPPTQNFQLLGGSPYGFPSDGRSYLSAWGSYYGGNVGGFGQATATQIPEWFQSYQIVVWSVPNSTQYLQLLMAPSLLTPNATLRIEARVVDNHQNVISTPTSFLILGPHGNVTVDSANGAMVFNQTIRSPPVATTDTFWVTVTVLNGGSIANGNSRSFEASVGPMLPDGLTPLTDSDITEFLHFGALNESLPSPYFYSAMYSDWFAEVGGEANLRPNPGEYATAVSDAYVFNGQPENFTYLWQPVSAPGGYFLNSCPPSSTQFFAGALYSPMDQTVRFRFSADDGVKIYLDGVAVVEDFEPLNHSSSDLLSISAGYHQVLIKLVNEYTLSLLTLNIEGTGLGWALAVPADVPPGSNPLQPGLPVLEVLSTSDIFVGLFDDDYINETTARPTLGAAVSGSVVWVDTVAVNGSFAVDASAVANPLLYGVQYLAFGLYAPADASIQFSFQIPDSVVIFFDGMRIMVADGSFEPNYSDEAYIPAGWHQVIVKLGARAGSVKQFSMTPATIDGVVAIALTAEVVLPPDVTLLTSLEPLTSYIALAASATLPNPNGQGSSTRLTGIIPFGPGTPNAQLTSADFDVANAVVEPYDSAAITAAPNAFFQWVPVELPPVGGGGNGFWGDYGMGGSFNQYVALTLYASGDMNGIVSQVDHLGAAYAMWIDGILVASAASPSNIPDRTAFDLAEGYHQLIVKLRMASDMTLNSLGPSMTWDQANAVCHQNQYQQVCSLAAYCPYGSPRPGVLPVSNSSFFMPYRDSTNGWVQTGAGGNLTSLCSTWFDTHGSTPDWGQIAEPLSIRGTVGCCGAQVRPQVSVAFDTSAVSAEGSAVLGWSFGFPAVSVNPPLVYVANPRSRHQTVVINCSAPHSKAFYTTDFSTPSTSSIAYTGPFTVRSSTFIEAICVVNSKSWSSVTFYQVYITPTPQIERTVCIAYAGCFVPVAGIDPGSFVSLVSNNVSSRLLAALLANISNAAQLQPSATFTGLLQVRYSDNGVIVPELAPGSYVAIAYRPSGTGQLAGTLNVQQITVFPSQVVGTSDAYLIFSGGVQSNDGVLLLDLAYPGSSCIAGSCARAFANFQQNVLVVNNNAGTYAAQVDLSRFVGTLTCMCVSASGAESAPQAMTPQGFVLMEEIVAAIATRVKVLAPNPDGDVINSISPLIFADSSSITFSGNFSASRNATLRDYTVGFVASSNQPNTVPTPTCAVTFANQSVLQCVANVPTSTSGLWQVQVYFHGTLIGLSIESPQLTGVPQPPQIVGASGACTMKSSNCVTGSVLFFYGSNFDTVTPSNERLVVGNNTSPGVMRPVSCPILNVTATYIACSLVISNTAANGLYPVHLSLYVSANYQLIVPANAALIIGAGDAPGWNGGGAPGQTPIPASTVSAPPSNVGVIAGALSGVVVLLAAVLLFIRYRYSLVPKSVIQSKEMDYIEEQLMEDQQRSSSPRGRASSLDPEEPVREAGQARHGYTAPYPPPSNSINNM